MPLFPQDGELAEHRLIRLSEEALAFDGPAGAADAARGVVAEIASRLPLFPGPGEPAVVQLDLGVAEARLGWWLTAGPQGGPSDRGWAEAPAATISQDLLELVQLVYGPPGSVRIAGRRVTIPGTTNAPRPGSGPGAAALSGRLRAQTPLTQPESEALAAAQQVIEACDGYRGGLAALVAHFGGGFGGELADAERCERHLAPLRATRARVLVLANPAGEPQRHAAALRVWKHYFARGLVFGSGPAHGLGVAEARLLTLDDGAAGAAGLLRHLRDHGPFDLVTAAGVADPPGSFAAAFAHVVPGGFFVFDGPLAGSAADGFAQQLVGVLQARHGGGSTRRTAGIHAVFAYQGITLVEKGPQP